MSDLDKGIADAISKRNPGVGAGTLASIGPEFTIKGFAEGDPDYEIVDREGNSVCEIDADDCFKLIQAGMLSDPKDLVGKWLRIRNVIS